MTNWTGIEGTATDPAPPPDRESPAPARMLLQWHVTDRCNLRCAHCYEEARAQADPSWDEWMATLGRLESFLASCRTRRAGRPFHAHVTVTGGEPFVRPDVLRLLARLAAADDGTTFAVLTNGTLVDRALARALAALRPGFVQVSLDGTPETHERIRGRRSHARAVEGIRQLVRARVPTFISFTVQRSNFREFPAVARLGRRLGVARVWADRLVPWGRARTRPEEVLSPEETREFVSLMHAESRRPGLRPSPLTLHRALQFTTTGGCPYRCAAGSTLLTVLPHGDVLPCRRMPIVVGNLHRATLEAIHDSSPVLRGLRDRSRVSRGCERCFYSATCGGGLRCLSYAVHGDPFRADPGCWLSDGHGEALSTPVRPVSAHPVVPADTLFRRRHARDRSPVR